MNKGEIARKQQYLAYIASPKWKNFKNSIILQRGRKCEQCGQTEGEIHAHHLTYIRFMNELDSDIQLLCKPCHMAKHRKKPKKKKAPQKKIRKKKTSKINPPAFDTEIQKRYKALHHYPMRKKIDIK